MKVRGTQKVVNNLDVNVDTVYIRSNIIRIENENFVGWEYDEEKINKNDYIGLLAKENQQINAQNVSLMLATTEMFEQSLITEQRNAETMIALTELYEMVLGG